jgi:hypothetical protein
LLCSSWQSAILGRNSLQRGAVAAALMGVGRAVAGRGEVRPVYGRVGRGAVVPFDVPSSGALHQRLSEWQDMIPAHFQIYPLINLATAQYFLRMGRTEGNRSIGL